MARKIVIIDTCILCVYLGVPYMDDTVVEGEYADADFIKERLEQYGHDGAQIVLPYAVIIETGNHITHIKDGNIRRRLVAEFSDLIEKTIEGNHPWQPFINHKELFDPRKLRELIQLWRVHGPTGLSVGDSTIKQIADFFYAKSFDVEIFTADGALRAWQPSTRPDIGKTLKRNSRRR